MAEDEDGLALEGKMAQRARALTGEDLYELASATEAALERQPAEDDNGWWTTLGEKVSRAFISGEVEYMGTASRIPSSR